jgi:hypothetical protein
MLPPVSGVQYCVVPGAQPVDGGAHNPFGCTVTPIGQHWVVG